MNNVDKQYQALLQDIIDNGVKKEDRTGTGTISVFGRQIRHNMKDGFPLLTTKKMPFKTIVTELLWFLRGDTNIKFLVDNNCHIWDGDAYKNYVNKTNEDNFKSDITLPPSYYPLDKDKFINKIKTDDEFAKEWGELGPIYGKQWRDWNGYISTEIERTTYSDSEGTYSYPASKRTYVKGIDQIQNSIDLLKTDPDSRRNRVSAWNVGELDKVVLPPCHTDFQFYTRELSLKEKEWQLEKTNCINDIENDRILYGHEWEKYIQEQYEAIQSSQDIKIPTRAISLMWNQRSVDTFLGLPFNIASYGLLLEIIAKEVNMVPDELIGSLGDVHLYLNHIEQAKEQIGRELSLSERREMVTQEMFNQIYNAGGPETLSHSEIDQWGIPRIKTREPFPLPTFDCPALDEIPHTTFDELVFKLQPADFYMDDYQSHPAIKAPLSN